MKTLKLKKDVIEHLSVSDQRIFKGGGTAFTFTFIPQQCVLTITAKSCGNTCNGNSCAATHCDCPGRPLDTNQVPCKDITVVGPDHTINNCFVTRQTCAC